MLWNNEEWLRHLRWVLLCWILFQVCLLFEINVIVWSLLYDQKCFVSSVGRASDWRSEGPVFDSQTKQLIFLLYLHITCTVRFLSQEDAEWRWGGIVHYVLSKLNYWYIISYYFRTKQLRTHNMIDVEFEKSEQNALFHKSIYFL